MIRMTLLLALVLSTQPSHALEWELVGMEGVEATTLSVDFHNERVLVGTNEGFHIHDLNSGHWTQLEDPGSTDKKVTSILTPYHLGEGLILGRVNANGEGYLELIQSPGTEGSIVYQSEGGPFVDFLDSGSGIYACSLAGSHPGELLKSEDEGASWTPVVGHGHSSMTALGLGDGGLYVAGDHQITKSNDGGTVWEQDSANLPNDQTVRCMELFHPGGCVITTNALVSVQDTIYHSFLYQSGQFNFEPILSTDFISIQTFYYPWGSFFASAGFAAVTGDGRLLISYNGINGWEDRTDGMPGEPLAVALCSFDGGLYVLTRNHGLYRHRNFVTSVGDDQPSLPQLGLRAWPNPFNPRVNLSYEMAEAGSVEMEVFDARGLKVENLYRGWKDAGSHRFVWGASGLASGVYLVKISSGDKSQSTRLVLVR